MKINFEEAIKLISQEWPFLGLYAYGAVITEHFNAQSDIDLAVLSKNSLAEEKIWNLKNKLASLLKHDIDLVDLQKAPTVLQFQVISSGKQISATDKTACESFEDLIYKMYARLNDERKEILEDIQKRGSVLGEDSHG